MKTKILIQQNLEVKDWPLSKPGDESFFGYVVAMGVFPQDWKEGNGLTPYVDFAYSDRYERYCLPSDEGLRKQLRNMLGDNLESLSNHDSISGKVWIRLDEQGYEVELP